MDLKSFKMLQEQRQMLDWILSHRMGKVQVLEYVDGFKSDDLPGQCLQASVITLHNKV